MDSKIMNPAIQQVAVSPAPETKVSDSLAVPDLILPTGRIKLTFTRECRAQIAVGEDAPLEVILPSGAHYELEIGRVFRARWRLTDRPEGIWSFFAEIGDEKYWIEQDGIQDWVINYSIAIPESVQ